MKSCLYVWGMENKLKAGQTFEVVEVLTDGGYSDKSLTKIGGFTIGNSTDRNNLFDILPNGDNIHKYPEGIFMRIIDELKPIGKLTIKKVK